MNIITGALPAARFSQHRLPEYRRLKVGHRTAAAKAEVGNSVDILDKDGRGDLTLDNKVHVPVPPQEAYGRQPANPGRKQAQAAQKAKAARLRRPGAVAAMRGAQARGAVGSFAPTRPTGPTLFGQPRRKPPIYQPE